MIQIVTNDRKEMMPNYQVETSELFSRTGLQGAVEIIFAK